MRSLIFGNNTIQNNTSVFFSLFRLALSCFECSIYCVQFHHRRYFLCSIKSTEHILISQYTSNTFYNIRIYAFAPYILLHQVYPFFIPIAASCLVNCIVQSFQLLQILLLLYDFRPFISICFCALFYFSFETTIERENVCLQCYSIYCINVRYQQWGSINNIRSSSTSNRFQVRFSSRFTLCETHFVELHVHFRKMCVCVVCATISVCTKYILREYR